MHFFGSAFLFLKENPYRNTMKKHLIQSLLLAASFFISSFSAFAQAANANGIANSISEVRPTLPGMIIPNTCVESSDKSKVCTEALFAEKPTVLVVYRGGWCPYCNAQLNRMKSIESALEFLGFQIVAISPDSNKNIAEQQSREELAYNLLADPKLELAKNMGLAYFLDKKTEEKYRDKLGVPFIDIDGDSRVALPVPAVYIIDQQGKVHFQYVNPDISVRLSENLLYTAASETMKVINKVEQKKANK